MAAKEAAGKPNDDHIHKWRGPKGYRYKGFGKSHKTSVQKAAEQEASEQVVSEQEDSKLEASQEPDEQKSRAKCVAVFTDFPVSNISQCHLLGED